jgi:hypothetical protein
MGLFSSRTLSHVVDLNDPSAQVPPGAAKNSKILLGQFAERLKGNTDVPAGMVVLLARKAAALERLPSFFEECMLTYVYPTSRCGGLSVADPVSIGAWQNRLNGDVVLPLLNAVRGAEPQFIAVPIAEVEVIHVIVLWGDSGASREDILLCAQKLQGWLGD